MREKIKNVGWGIIGFSVLVLIFLVATFILDGVSNVIENYNALISTVNNWVTGFVVILLILSVFPKLREYTGAGIVISTFIWGATLWFFSLFVTYQLWGILGVIVGIVFLGIGVFATAFLALIFDGQASGAFLILLSLVMIYAVRMLGVWITSKARVQSTENTNV